MTISEQFVPHKELLELFGVQRNATLKRMLDRNNINYVLDYRNNPLVLRTSLLSSNTVQYEEKEATFTSVCESGEGQRDGAPTLSWED
jgi:hypothetical protein